MIYFNITMCMSTLLHKLAAVQVRVAIVHVPKKMFEMMFLVAVIYSFFFSQTEFRLYWALNKLSETTGIDTIGANNKVCIPITMFHFVPINYPKILLLFLTLIFRLNFSKLCRLVLENIFPFLFFR